MCPQPPRLSPEYSHKAGLQTVITGMPLQIRPVTRGGHAGPVTMGRITRGPLSWTRPHGGMTTSQAFAWCRIRRRVSLPVLSPSDQRLQRRPRAKGGVFAFAPTRGFDRDESEGPSGRRGKDMKLLASESNVVWFKVLLCDLRMIHACMCSSFVPRICKISDQA
jgi:hypothetical protein